MTATSSPAEPPESTLAAVASVLDAYAPIARAQRGCDDGCGCTDCEMVEDLRAILAATPTAARVEATCTCGKVWAGHPNPHAITCPDHSAAHVAELEAALAAAEARLRAVVFRVEVACDGYSALTEADVPDEEFMDFDSYIAGAKAAADEIRAALATPPQPAP